MEEWNKHFRKLLGEVGQRVVKGNKKVREKDNEERKIKKGEMRKVMRSLKERKAAGSDGIPKKVQEYGGGVVEEWM